MLQQLEIQNVALVEKVSLEFGSGLNILTGETGAGKSIIIDSLQAILGERLPKDIIRTGTDKALVEAVFSIKSPELDLLLSNSGIEPEEDGTVIISREFNTAGKNTCRVNGKLITVSILKEIGEKIVDVHGQHDNQSLLRTESHIELLDAFGGEKLQKLKEEYSQYLEEYRKVRNRLKAYSGDVGERERRTDLLRFQVDEIRNAGIKADEEEELNKKRLRLSNAEKIMSSLAEAYESLFSGGRNGKSSADSLNEAISHMGTIARLDEKYEALSERLKEISYLLEDIVSEIRDERDGVEYDPNLLGKVEERLDLLFKLKKKYGGSLEKVLEYFSKAQQELEAIERSEETVKALEAELASLEKKLYSSGEKLHQEREAAAKRLEGAIGSQLDDLEMKKAQFKVNILFEDAAAGLSNVKFNSNGLDKVEFLISPNTGEPLKPLSKIASGGEMSRIMLAIKTILADVDRMPTLVFDEIDIGISGKASLKVGEKLSYISRNHQVLCVTHLAQIASMADSHYLISKASVGERTETKVEKLEENAVTCEIARIISGNEMTDTSRKLAAEMLDYARKIKSL